MLQLLRVLFQTPPLIAPTIGSEPDAVWRRRSSKREPLAPREDHLECREGGWLVYPW
jgi:hypothetical protein